MQIDPMPLLARIFAIRESERNASKIVLEKLIKTSQSFTGGQTSQLDWFSYSESNPPK